MLEILIISIFPAVFLFILFYGEYAFKQRRISMGGTSPINKFAFATSKYSILLIWGTVLLQSFGLSISPIEVPGSVHTSALILWVLGFSIMIIGRIEMGKSFRIGTPGEETNFISSGLYRYSRNPMYVGVFTTIVAAVLYTFNPIVLAVGIYIIVVHHRIVLAEEAFMLSVFTDKYQNYRKKVRRYI